MMFGKYLVVVFFFAGEVVDFVVFAAVFFPPAFATHSKSSLEEVNLCAKVMGKRGDGCGCWLWVVFDIRKTSPGAALRTCHIGPGCEAVVDHMAVAPNRDCH